MFRNLFVEGIYGNELLTAQISLKLLLFAYAGTSIVAVIFGFFLWRKTKKLSSFYLFLMSLSFGILCFLDFATWASTPKAIMYTWSIDYIFYSSLFVSSYWFVYSFIKNKDLPTWQMAASLSTLIPCLVMTSINMYVDTFDTVNYIAWESDAVVKFETFFEIFFILLIAFFTFTEYKKAVDSHEKKRIALVGGGVLSLLFMINFWGIVSLLVEYFNLWGYADIGYYYNFQIYGLFGMPILLAFLGYLIMKYQAFDLKPIKSVALVIGLMLILFVSTFV